MNAIVLQKLENQLNSADSREAIEQAVTEALKYGQVVADEQEADNFFRSMGITDEVTHQPIISKFVEVWNEEHQGEETFWVNVIQHFTDPGSVDYVYSYTIE